MDAAFNMLKEDADNFVSGGSGWAYNKIEELRITISKYQVNDRVLGNAGQLFGLGGSYIPLPPWISNKKAAINPMNEDDQKCFHYCMEMFYHDSNKNLPKLNRNRTSNYPWEGRHYNYEGMNFPVSIKDIDIFEKTQVCLLMY